jgi:anaerobic selenocysteine-containing dehydrogenase
MEEPGVEGGVKAFRTMKAQVEETLARDSTLTAALGYRQHERDKKRQHYIVPGWQWMYYRAGFKDRLNDRANHDPSYRDFESYVDEANQKGWWDGFIGPDQERAPVRDRVFISVGGDHMRRLTGSSVINDQYTPGLQKLIKVDFRMSATTLHADLVLPACGYYEKIHVRRSQLWLMDQAVKPLGESRSDYAIACLLAKYLSKRAKERGIGEIQDERQGTTLDLANFYDKYTVKGAYGEDDEAKLADTMFRIAAAIGYLPKGSNLETVRKNRGWQPGNMFHIPLLLDGCSSTWITIGSWKQVRRCPSTNLIRSWVGTIRSIRREAMEGSPSMVFGSPILCS